MHAAAKPSLEDFDSRNSLRNANLRASESTRLEVKHRKPYESDEKPDPAFLDDLSAARSSKAIRNEKLDRIHRPLPPKTAAIHLRTSYLLTFAPRKEFYCTLGECRIPEASSKTGTNAPRSSSQTDERNWKNSCGEIRGRAAVPGFERDDGNDATRERKARNQGPSRGKDKKETIISTRILHYRRVDASIFYTNMHFPTARRKETCACCNILRLERRSGISLAHPLARYQAHLTHSSILSG